MILDIFVKKREEYWLLKRSVLEVILEIQELKSKTLSFNSHREFPSCFPKENIKTFLSFSFTNPQSKKAFSKEPPSIQIGSICVPALLATAATGVRKPPPPQPPLQKSPTPSRFPVYIDGFVGDTWSYLIFVVVVDAFVFSFFFSFLVGFIVFVFTVLWFSELQELRCQANQSSKRHREFRILSTNFLFHFL